MGLVHAVSLPGQVARPAGTAVSFAADGGGGGTWRVVRTDTCWELDPAGSPRPLACEARTTVDGAIKLYTRDPAAPPLSWQGDDELAGALMRVKAILG